MRMAQHCRSCYFSNKMCAMAGFSPVGKANRGKTKVWCSHSCAGFSDDVIVLFSVVVLIFYAGFWYLTNVVTCIKYVPYIFHYRLYAPLAILWQGKGLLSVHPPFACYFAAIFTQKWIREIRGIAKGMSRRLIRWRCSVKEKVSSLSQPICFLFACVFRPKWNTKSEVLPMVGL